MRELTRSNGNAQPFFIYHLAHQRPVTIPDTDYPIGAPHPANISIRFANADKNLDFYIHSEAWPQAAGYLSHMSALWAGFARSGVPHTDEVDEWPLAFDL